MPRMKTKSISGGASRPVYVRFLRDTLCGLVALTALGCSKPSAVGQEPAASGAAAPEAAEVASAKAAAPAAADPAAAAASAPQSAQIGQPAPDFSLPDLDGKQVSLSQFKGKPVVLEWFNPGCPFVRNSHTKGSLKTTAATETAKGVAWLAINSGAPGKQGAGAEASRKGASEFAMQHPVLLDESGSVGKLYGAERTPHIYVINPEGVLVYRGAVDNSPDGEGQSPEGGKLVNYVTTALESVRSGAALAMAETKAYGCSVKY
jgi:peroxiredoxin